MIKRFLHSLGHRYIQFVCRREHEAQRFRPKEKVAEYSFLFKHLARMRAIDILDVGSGTTAYAAVLRECGYVVTCIDKGQAYWSVPLVNRHSHIIEQDILAPTLTRKFDVITCIMTVQGIPQADAAVESMFRLLNPGGSLIMSLPFNAREHVANVYELPEAAYGKDLTYIAAVFSADDLKRWAERSGATLADQEYWRCFTGRLWACGERVWPPQQTSAEEPHHMSCVLFRKGNDE
jgi:2-polyprenyl-3-methyl-5-hydroxy-6-metoxy-1,4-benzoquinol methylase